MIRMIRHLSVCLWFGLWISLPVIFATLPSIQDRVNNIPMELLSCGLFIIICFCISLGLTIAGNILIRCRLRKAMAWEQAGILHRASRQYEKAVALYDSFLVSPFFEKNLTESLIHSLAVFSLSGSANPCFHFLGTASLYLQAHPNDAELAGLWLERFPTDRFSSNRPMERDTLTQKVLASLAYIHRDHHLLSSMILKIFLKLGRTDYPAMQLYRHMLEKPDLDQELRKEIYLLVGGESEKKEFGELLETEWGKIPGDQEIHIFREPPMDSEIPSSKKKNRAQKTFRTMAAGLTIAVMAGMCARIYLNPSRPMPFFSSVSGTRISEGYSIQLGAFLDKSLAESLTEKLRQYQSRPVQIIQIKGGKKIWYIVRIQGFKNRDAAREYGSILESEKIIQNFFVCVSES